MDPLRAPVGNESISTLTSASVDMETRPYCDPSMLKYLREWNLEAYASNFAGVDIRDFMSLWRPENNQRLRRLVRHGDQETVDALSRKIQGLCVLEHLTELGLEGYFPNFERANVSMNDFMALGDSENEEKLKALVDNKIGPTALLRAKSQGLRILEHLMKWGLGRYFPNFERGDRPV
ncbi:hypothetical protein Q5P01_019997 [Channa striata]|uniref:Uncharacterized protein n=1 Tax=Channa striata TaxID=64152 RepID=A0AA88LWV8_CHASR|nr:hypothetical protein Q5P01_019997 [Channa striata]